MSAQPSMGERIESLEDGVRELTRMLLWNLGDPEACLDCETCAEGGEGLCAAHEAVNSGLRLVPQPAAELLP